MKFKGLFYSLSIVCLATVSVSSPAFAITFITERADVKANDRVDWSSLGSVNPFHILPNSFQAKSQNGLGLTVEVPPAQPGIGISPPLVFQTLPPPGIRTNFSSGDYILLTGATVSPPPLDGNPGLLTITFDSPVLGAGTQIAVGRTLQPYQTFISAFDSAGQELGTFSLNATSNELLDNSAVFLGVRSDSNSIKRLVFSSSVPNLPFGINTISLATVPEPTSTLSLLLVSILGMCFGLSPTRRRKPKREHQRGGSLRLSF